MRLLSGKIEDDMRYIGYYQLAGGFLGIILVFNSFIYERSLSGLTLVFYSIIFLLFGFSLYCGNLLRKGNIKGLSLTTYNQFLQLVQFFICGIGFTYYSGIAFSVGIQVKEKILPDFIITISEAKLSYINNGINHSSVYINFVPILIIYLIWRIESEIESRKELMESAEKSKSNMETGD